MCERLVAACRKATDQPILAKLTPNVTSIAEMAVAAAEGGADALSLINTCQGMAIDWRRRRPLLGNIIGGLSGPAIKPIALRAVYQAAQATKAPIIGIAASLRSTTSWSFSLPEPLRFNLARSTSTIRLPR